MDHLDICGAISILEIVTGKWKPIILAHLIKEGTMRFSELKNSIPDITPRMLTLHLRELEEHHIIHRAVYPQVPPKVEYSMTEHGKSLEPVIKVMHHWGIRHMKFLEENAVAAQATSGPAVRIPPRTPS